MMRITIVKINTTKI